MVVVFQRRRGHVGADADTALVEEIAVTPANVNDGKAGPDALPDNPGEVFADSAYRGNHFSDAVRAKGGTERVIATAMWGRDEAETLARLDAWNQPIHRIRGRIEKIFGTWKRSYGLRRMRWLDRRRRRIGDETTRPPTGRRLKADVAMPATAHCPPSGEKYSKFNWKTLPAHRSH
ncbi:transposase [Ensifer sp. SL37]|uniref:transposase n=1 Tax=Ensifer sp. SL37 TaxID=2995137 RepID=UPI0022756594|nr:transposase [Ensifer sp. SL37]MCY1740532.1 transposase [Ensifer sp. SL37]